jgi:hypothetical protein
MLLKWKASSHVTKSAIRKMKLTTAVLVFVSSFVSSVSFAQPSNDECSDSLVIPPAPSFPYASTVLNFQDATEGADDPLLSCLFFPLDNSTVLSATVPPSSFPPIVVNKVSIWYSWAPSSSGSFDFFAIGDSELYGSFYPSIALFQGTTCGDALEEIFCGSGYATAVEVAAGATYFMFIESDIYDDSALGSIAANMTLKVQPTPPSPPNDECTNAAVIPAAPTFPYSTVAVEVAQATENPNDPLLTCNFFVGSGDNSTFAPSFIALDATSAPSFFQSDGKTVWYSWTPAESGSYDFSTTGSLDPYGYELSTSIGIFEGLSCDDVDEIECKGGDRLRGAELQSGTTYRIKVGAFADYGTLILTVKPTPPPPPNDSCVGAISIDPRSGAVVANGDTFDAILDSELENTCFTLDAASGVWYKIDNTVGDVLAITASTCDEGTNFDTKITIFKGDVCGSALECVGSVDDSSACGLSSEISFLANEPTTYWILVHGYGTSAGNFTLTVDGVSNFLTLINSETNGAIELLGGAVDYSLIQSSKLNIQASFGNDISVESVQVTFDNPARSFCEKDVPYSIFGDLNGNFFDKKLPLGPHLVTASAYAQSGCQGPVSTVLSQSFEVFGCGLYFDVYDASDDSVVFYLEEGIELPSLPCDVNIEAIVYCGFDVEGVRLELLDTATDTVISTRTETVAPYFLFGDTNGNISPGAIAPGAYSITAWIDGIQHPSLSFTVVDGCF